MCPEQALILLGWLIWNNISGSQEVLWDVDEGNQACLGNLISWASYIASLKCKLPRDVYRLAVCKRGFYLALVHMLWKVFVFTKNLAPMQLGGSYTQWEAWKLVLKFGEVFLTSVDSGIFLAYLYFFPTTSNPTIASYFFLPFFSPDLFHFITSSFPQNFLSTFCFQATLASIL